MNIQYQDLSIARDRIIKKYMDNPNRSISSVFRFLRAKSYISFIGDYPILATIINTLYALDINPTRFQINYALNKSDELKNLSKQDKNSLLNQLFNLSYVQIKTENKTVEKAKKQNMNNMSF